MEATLAGQQERMSARLSPISSQVGAYLHSVAQAERELLTTGVPLQGRNSGQVNAAAAPPAAVPRRGFNAGGDGTLQQTADSHRDKGLARAGGVLGVLNVALVMKGSAVVALVQRTVAQWSVNTAVGKFARIAEPQWGRPGHSEQKMFQRLLTGMQGFLGLLRGVPGGCGAVSRQLGYSNDAWGCYLSSAALLAGSKRTAGTSEEDAQRLLAREEAVGARESEVSLRERESAASGGAGVGGASWLANGSLRGSGMSEHVSREIAKRMQQRQVELVGPVRGACKGLVGEPAGLRYGSLGQVAGEAATEMDANFTATRESVRQGRRVQGEDEEEVTQPTV